MAAMTSFYAEKVLPPRECTDSVCSAHVQQRPPVPDL